MVFIFECITWVASQSLRDQTAWNYCPEAHKTCRIHLTRLGQISRPAWGGGVECCWWSQCWPPPWWSLQTATGQSATAKAWSIRQPRNTSDFQRLELGTCTENFLWFLSWTLAQGSVGTPNSLMEGLAELMSMTTIYINLIVLSNGKQLNKCSWSLSL